MITSFFQPKSSPKSKRSSPNNGANSTIQKRAKVDNTGSASTSSNSQNLPPTPTLTQPVEDFLTSLTEDSWRKALMPHFASPSFTSLSKFVTSERSKNTVYPPPCDTFSALNLVPLDKVKIVIVGQDPYHQPNQGHGLAFSVRKGQAIPPSLRNIYKELMEDKNIDEFQGKPTHGFLERWARQGVLMLNAVLTVRRSEANSHANKGWEKFTDEIIRVLLKAQKKKSSDDDDDNIKSGLVFLLWGKPASKKAESVISRVGGGSKANNHTIICTSHPSPLGATKTNKPFLGSKCFSRANKALEDLGHNPIHWSVDGPLMEEDNDSEKPSVEEKAKSTEDPVEDV